MGTLLILHFVEDEQAVGSFSAGGSLGMAGKEDDGGLAQDAAHGPGGFAPKVAVEGVVKSFIEAANAAAEAIAGGGEDHVASFEAQEIEHVDEQVGHGFVFTALAAEEKEVLTAVLVVNAVDDGVERLKLVVVKGQSKYVCGKSTYVT
jgi:hypothetical protein